MLGIKLKDRVPNFQIRSQTKSKGKVKGVWNRITKLKGTWAGQLTRRQHGRWSKAITEWHTRLGTGIWGVAGRI